MTSHAKNGPLRRSLVTTADAAVDAHIRDGMTIALGGFHTASRAMALVRAIVRAGRRDLTLIGSPATLDADLLIATGCVRRVVLPFIGVEGMAPVAPFFRRAAENGTLDIAEIDEGIVLTMFKAARQGMGSLPWIGGVGTSITSLNPDLRPVEDPLTGKPVLAVPAVRPDVTLVHAARADAHGNVQHGGNQFADALMASASATTIVQVEEIVPTSDIRARPELTTIPAHMVGAVVHCPFGAHPFFSQRRYVMDRVHVKAYLGAARSLIDGSDPAGWDGYLETFVFGPASHGDYIDTVGAERLKTLEERSEAMAS